MESRQGLADGGKRGATAWKVCVLILLVTLIAFPVPLPPARTIWISGSPAMEDWLRRRLRIAYWLVYTNALLGESRSELVARLGEPDASPESRPSEATYNL